MGKRKPGLSLEQHKELGLELAVMRDRLVKISVLIGNAYPLQSSANKRIHRALRELDESRSELDSLVFKEHLEQATPSIYYPPQKERTA